MPDSILDPGAVHTEAGAIGYYYNTLLQFSEAVGGLNSNNFVRTTGLMTDELTLRTLPDFPRSADDFLDGRFPYDGSLIAGSFGRLNDVRGFARESRGFLRTFAPNLSSALLGQMFAVEGMTDVMLAELFCSGVPLSSLDFNADYTLTPGYSTEEVYHVALGLFDSADVYLSDSAGVKTLVQLVRGRALIGLGMFEAAREAVRGVETSFRYTSSFNGNRKKWTPEVYGNDLDLVIASLKGGTGLPFREVQDPRTKLPESTNPTAPLVIATGIEARLIEAEAALFAEQGEWLTILNQLRTTCADIPSCQTPAPPGSGGIGGLPPLEDPAPGVSFSDPMAKEARVRLLFEERAYWLFLTGRRQGDLRRLVRLYGYPQETVYPSGIWGMGNYGDRVVLPVPESERDRNALYEGCQDYDA